jgi:hypothetical protein
MKEKGIGRGVFSRFFSSLARFICEKFHKLDKPFIFSGLLRFAPFHNSEVVRAIGKKYRGSRNGACQHRYYLVTHHPSPAKTQYNTHE